MTDCIPLAGVLSPGVPAGRGACRVWMTKTASRRRATSSLLSLSSSPSGGSGIGRPARAAVRTDERYGATDVGTAVPASVGLFISAVGRSLRLFPMIVARPDEFFDAP